MHTPYPPPRPSPLLHTQCIAVILTSTCPRGVSQVRDRAQAAVPGDEFCSMVSIIEGAPDSKQVADRAIALANIESIAERAQALHMLPLRGDVSGCGRKLHNIRQGRLAPNMREEALGIVRRVLGGQPENSAVLAQLEASIEQSVARHNEANANTLARSKRLLAPTYAAAPPPAYAAAPPPAYAPPPPPAYAPPQPPAAYPAGHAVLPQEGAMPPANYFSTAALPHGVGWAPPPSGLPPGYVAMPDGRVLPPSGVGVGAPDAAGGGGANGAVGGGDAAAVDYDDAETVAEDDDDADEDDAGGEDVGEEGDTVDDSAEA